MAKRDDPDVQFGWLLEELCIKLGFCLPRSEAPRLQALLPAGPDRFTDAVFEAEQMDPLLHADLRRQVHETVVTHMDRWATWANEQHER